MRPRVRIRQRHTLKCGPTREPRLQRARGAVNEADRSGICGAPALEHSSQGRGEHQSDGDREQGRCAVDSCEPHDARTGDVASEEGRQGAADVDGDMPAVQRWSIRVPEAAARYVRSASCGDPRDDGQRPEHRRQDDAGGHRREREAKGGDRELRGPTQPHGDGRTWNPDSAQRGPRCIRVTKLGDAREREHNAQPCHNRIRKRVHPCLLPFRVTGARQHDRFGADRQHLCCQADGCRRSTRAAAEVYS